MAALVVSCTPRDRSAEDTWRFDDEAFDPLPVRLSAGTGEGSITLEPDRLTAAAPGTYRVTFHVGTGGVEQGGGLLVSFPKSWFSELYPWSKPFQLKYPRAAHYVHAEASADNVALSVQLQQLNFDGKSERFPHLVLIELSEGSLVEGDELAVSLVHTTAPFLAGDDEVIAAVDARGDGRFRQLRHSAPFRVLPGEAERFLLLAPSQAIVGRPVTLQVSSLDHYNNVAASQRRVHLEGLEDGSLTPTSDAPEEGFVHFRWTPGRKGFHWPAAVVGPLEEGSHQLLRVAGGPIRVYELPPAERIFWGDLHTHSDISKDAIGHDPFGYARRVTRLDFVATTEHSDDDHDWRHDRGGITPAEWRGILAAVDQADRPGSFVPLLGYECTLHLGHHNVFLRSKHGLPINPRRVGTVEKLWARLDPDKAFTIPHHMGRLTNIGHLPRVERRPRLTPPPAAPVPAKHGPLVDWRDPPPDPPRLRPALEIYSSHGTSELYDLDDPLTYSKVGYLPSVAAKGPHYARDAWQLGHRVGTVGGSDNHTAQPGLDSLGLTAVRAPRLRRELIFDAIVARKTYATTGERIYLEFEVGGTRMGGVGRARRNPSGRVLIAAPSALRVVEVLRWDSSARTWSVAKSWTDPGRLLRARFDDRVAAGEVIYYLRAELVATTAGRVARAWSSPIWLTIYPRANQ